MKTRIATLFFSLISVALIQAQDTISLAGEWDFSTSGTGLTSVPSTRQTSITSKGQSDERSYDGTAVKFGDTMIMPASMP